MKKILTLFVMLVSTAAFSQLGGEDEVYLSGDVTPPSFQGGDVTAFHKFVREHFNLAKAKTGKMVASFTVGAEGEIKNLRILEFKDADAAQEFIRVIKSAPKWEPAKRQGKSVPMDIKLPLEFR